MMGPGPRSGGNCRVVVTCSSSAEAGPGRVGSDPAPLSPAASRAWRGAIGAAQPAGPWGSRKVLAILNV